jgi:hypothetical protein
LHDFNATVVAGKPNELHLSIFAPNSSEAITAEAERAVSSLPAIGDNIAARELRLIVVRQHEACPRTGAKRKIEVLVP